MTDMSSVVNRDMRLLSPWFAEKVVKALAKCHSMGYPIEVFEGFRTPDRQDWLYAQGRTRPGAVVTKARAWESAHQLGVAVDIASRVAGKWSWDFPVDKVREIFVGEGLESLAPFENAHYQRLGGMSVKAALAVARKSGVQGLWIALA